MLFEHPEPDDLEADVIAQIEDLRQRLRRQLYEPRRWFGSLRRLSLARAIQGSSSIEGFSADLDDVAAAVDGEEPLDADTETRMALRGYREAMTYVIQLASDEDFGVSEQLVKSLHFMMTSYDLASRPGLWRVGSIYIHNEATGEIVYEGPDVDRVPELMGELAEAINTTKASPPMVKAGMAHLNLVMIHPFRDGNGRMARCLQTLILAREGVLAPQFCSIEEYLGRNTKDYYEVLGDVGKGSWHPEGDARRWVRFILTAHYRQAQTLLYRVRESEQLWLELESLIAKHGFPERVLSALFDAALGLRVRRGSYKAMLENDISEQAAGRDLSQLASKGILVPHGEKRGRYYTASQELDQRWKVIRAKRGKGIADPFAA